MGNTDSQTSYEWSSQMRASDAFKNLSNRALKMKVIMTLQEDGIIHIQDRNNLVRSNTTINPPKTEADISRALKEISNTINKYSQG